MIMLFAIAAHLSYAQDHQVKGKVSSSSDGTGIPGVNVQLKGTAVGTVTDAEGVYSIEVKGSGAILVFSSIGLIKKEIPVGNQTTIDVVMEDDIKNLTEVVVTGYAAQRKKDITGAVTVINPKELTSVPSERNANAARPGFRGDCRKR
jgi:hypothetical protein